MTLDEDQTQDGKVAGGKETPFVADAAPISDQTGPGPDAGDVEFDSMEADFEAALDIGKWTSGEQMHTLAARLERDFEQAARHEEGMAPRILRALEDGLPNAADASKENGLYTLRPDEITGALKNVLFNGLVEGCDGTRVMVPTLPMTVVQIGVCLTSYQGSGDGGSIGHRLYRHDIIRRNGNAENAVYDFLARRARRRMRRGTEFGDDGQETSLSDMMCRALMTYGERAMLADRSQRPWRIGHGGPMPHELIVGSGRKELAFASLKMLRRLLLDHKKFIFVPSEIGDEAVVTIANALLPLQYAVLRNTKDIIQGYIEGSSYERPHYERSGLIQEVRAFQQDAGSKTVLCVYRSSSLAPGRIFYAHEDHVHEAAQIVMADSTLQETRGFPNLIDIADRMCRGMFEPGGLTAQVHAALARTGSPFRFLNERETRA